MEETKHKETPTEASGYIAGLGLSALCAACRGKHMSAAIIVLAGAILLLGGSFIAHSDTQLFVQIVGTVLVVLGLIGWFLGSPKP